MGIGASRHEDTQHRLARCIRYTLHAVTRYKSNRPDTLSGILDRHDTVEFNLSFAKREVGHLFDATVDLTDHRRTEDSSLEPLENPASQANRDNSAEKIEHCGEKNQKDGEPRIAAASI